MRIGSLLLENMTVLAPLAGITNLPFRLLMKEAGCALVCTEMISAKGLVYRAENTLKMMESHHAEKPLSIQIFGSDPRDMAEAAVIAQSAGGDIIDINMGCPVKKVLKTGSGAALMKEPKKTEAIIIAVRKAVTTPMTIKLRTGWDSSGDQALNIVRIAQDCGVDAVAVHPRTVSQGFGGSADWSIIAKVKNAITIPVIGNGDIVNPEVALNMISRTGCDGVMIGRAAIGNPWIFSQILALLDEDMVKPVSLSDRFDVMVRYLNSSVAYLGEQRACKMMRSRLGWFVKGLPNAGKFRESIKYISSEKQAMELIGAYQYEISNP